MLDTVLHSSSALHNKKMLKTIIQQSPQEKVNKFRKHKNQILSLWVYQHLDVQTARQLQDALSVVFAWLH